MFELFNFWNLKLIRFFLLKLLIPFHTQLQGSDKLRFVINNRGLLCLLKQALFLDIIG